MLRTLAAATLAVVCFAAEPVRAEIDSVFGNTVVSRYPDGGWVKHWFNPDGSYVAHFSDGRRLSARWQQELDARIRTLTQLRDQLDGCIGCGCLSLQRCQLVNPSDRLAEEGTGAVSLTR